jgi:hypothetical protein
MIDATRQELLKLIEEMSAACLFVRRKTGSLLPRFTATWAISFRRTSIGG